MFDQDPPEIVVSSLISGYQRRNIDAISPIDAVSSLAELLIDRHVHGRVWKWSQVLFWDRSYRGDHYVSMVNSDYEILFDSLAVFRAIYSCLAFLSNELVHT